MKLPLALITITLLAAGCGGMGASGGGTPAASASLQPRSGSSTTGTVAFSPRSGKMMVTIDISGLKPNAEHGFHVHEKGDCSAPDAMSAGGHFNPLGKPHGGSSGDHHAGDIQNIKSDASGRARGSFEVNGLTIGGATDVVGKAVVVHRDPDDYKSQPAGNSGPRIACGLIVKA